MRSRVLLVGLVVGLVVSNTVELFCVSDVLFDMKDVAKTRSYLDWDQILWLAS